MLRVIKIARERERAKVREPKTLAEGMRARERERNFSYGFPMNLNDLIISWKNYHHVQCSSYDPKAFKILSSYKKLY